ncbi:FtsX-like permease family protein [Spirosoma terrae]|uniref:FtsX-like permease family protein n=2 Tax=Spirosoma terrae TaxID=1968276 RepID=A0A6L9LDG6_9BACT|nr:FtsX-like permease family protein [Spirosoma terrae]
MRMSPPRWATRLLHWFCAPHLVEEMEGDLDELFQQRIREVGLRQARRRYVRDVLSLARPFVLKRQPKPQYTAARRFSDQSTNLLLNPTMLRNYASIAFRQLWKNQLFSALNIVGLTVGLAVSTFIALYVWHEFHYDRFEPFADRTYRIMSVAKYGEQEIMLFGLHESFGEAVKKQIPDVEAVARISDGSAILESDQNHRFNEEHIGFADASALPLLGLRVLQGDPKTALSEPGRIVLTRQLAEKYFGTQQAVGKTLVYEKHFPLTVSAVLDDLPTNSIIQFNGLVSLRSMPTLGTQQQFTYKAAGFLSTFLVLRPGANVALVEKKLEQVKAGIQFVDMSAKYFLEALPSLHLDSRSVSKDGWQSLYILLTVALVILVLAVINYVSLTTARATKRAREVGIRKAIGGQRSELIGQFFMESFLSTTLAFLLSLLLLQLFFPWANQALDLNIDNRVLGQGPYWGLMIALWLGCSLLSGIYPALMLSGFRPATVLKGATGWRKSGVNVRSVFTTVQFTASIGLLICSVVLYTQMQFLRTKNLGINQSQVLGLFVDSEMAPHYAGLRNDIRQWAGPANVAFSNVAIFTDRVPMMFVQAEKNKKQLMVNTLSVDKSFFDMMGVRWRHLPQTWDMGPLQKELIVYNQTLISEAGIKGNPLQQPAPLKDQPTDGVVADFHIRSLHGTVSPMKLTVVSDTNRSVLKQGGYLLIRLTPQTDVSIALEKLKEIYNRNQPTAPFNYYFLDDAYNQLYAKETRLMRLFNGFTALTLLVACLGLLGLVTFSIETRTKEIGVRKVLGASVSGIVMLLSKDFLKLIGISLLLASPIAWWAMNQWLQDFAYKIDIAWWMFALAGLLVAGIALLTVSLQSIKAALTNPVKSLRNE